MLIGYARVSTGEQDLALQLDALKAAGCARTFSDTSSGSLRERPKLQRALEELRDGQDTLVVWRLDRLGRSLRHLIDTVGELEDRKVGFRSLTEGIDTTTSAGRLVFHIFGALAQFERELIRERTQAGLAAARACGRRGGRPAVMTRQKLRVARQLLANGEHTMQEIASTVGVGRATLYRHLMNNKAAVQDGPVPGGIDGAGAAQNDQATLQRAADDAERATEESAKPTRTRSRTGTRSSGHRSRRALRSGTGTASDRRQWLNERCPTCGAAPGARCRTHGAGKTRKLAARLHVARGWHQRQCPTCHAQPGQECLAPSGRRASRPHQARIHPVDGELTLDRQVWEELERRGASIASIPFTGHRRPGASFGPVTLGRVENNEYLELERWEGSGDQLIEALKAPVSDQFGSFAGQPVIRGTLSWTTADHRIMITAKRGEQPFEEIVR